MAEDFRIKTEKESIEIQNHGLEYNMDVKTIGDINTKFLITGLEIKNENDTSSAAELSNQASNRIKHENNIIENWMECNSPTGIDKKAVEVKVEPYMNVEEFEHTESLAVTEIDIKDENDTSLETPAESALNSNPTRKGISKEDEIERIYLEACAKYEKLNKRRIYNQISLNCIRCNVNFNCKRMLDDHIIKKHPDLIGSVSYKIHECTICSYKTTVAPDLARHRMKHCETGLALDHKLSKSPALRPSACHRYEIYECTICSYKTTAAPDIARHSMDHCETGVALDHKPSKPPNLKPSVSYKIHECADCSYRTTTATDLAKHRSKHLERQVASEYKLSTCTDCNAKFKTRKTLDNHIIKKHPDLMDTVSCEIYACAKCKFKTTAWRAATKHTCVTSHTEIIPGGHNGTPFQCCGKAFKRKIFLDDHITKNHPDMTASVSSEVYECAMCMYKTTMKRCLARHMTKHSGKTENLKHKVFHKPSKPCMACNVTFKSKASLDDHIIKNHPDLIASVTTTIHLCPRCSYKTTGRRNLERHILLQHPETSVNYEPCICTCCDSKFKNRIRLDDHTLKKHPDLISLVSSEIYACTDCAYKTTTRRYLYRHIMTQHHPVSRSGHLQHRKCLECGSTFRSKKSLDDHIIKKHPHLSASVTSKVHQCPICGYRTTQASDSVRHMFKHPEADGKYGLQYSKCPRCVATFRSKMALDDHIFRLHPEILSSISNKIQVCSICPYKTIMTRNFHRHLLKHRQEACRYKETICVRCKTEFKTKYALHDHITRKHPDLRASVSSKIYECTSCTYKSTMKRNFTRHLSRHPETSANEKLSIWGIDNSTD